MASVQFQHPSMKERDTEPAVAADAYLTFIAIIHQVYIQQCFFTFDTHTCTHHHTTKYGQHYSFSTNFRCFPWHGSKRKKMLPKIKTVTGPAPGPSFFSFTTKWKRSEGQCFRTPVHLLLRTLKQSPSLGFIEGGVKTELTEGKPGSGRAWGQAQWFRQLGSSFERCRLYNLLPNTGWSSSFGIQLPCQRWRIVADSIKWSLKWTVFTNISYTILVSVLVQNDQRTCS